MPSCVFDTPDLLRLLGGRVKLGRLREAVPMLGVDLESIDELEVVVEVFPNRPDMLCVEGFARSLRGFLGIEAGLPSIVAEDSKVVLRVDSSVDSVRPCVCAGFVRGVDLTGYGVKSLMDVQEKLHLTHGRNRLKVAVGVHDADKVEGPFTYTTVKPNKASFVPLGFQQELTLAEILESHPKGREYAWTLEGKSRYPLIIDKGGRVLSFPPIINGELTKVTEDTVNLFIELTGTSQRAVDVALNIVSCALQDRGGRLETVRLTRKGK